MSPVAVANPAAAAGWLVAALSCVGLLAVLTVVLRKLRRQRHELQLADGARRRLAAIAEHAESPMALIDRERRITWANPAFCRLVEAAAPELQGTVLSVLDGPRTDAALLQAAKDEMQVGHGFALESWLSGADGADHWVHVNCQPVRELTGRVDAWVVILTDMTGRRAEESELAGRTFRLEAATAAGGIGLWETEAGFQQLWLDSTARRLLGLPAGQDRFALAVLAGPADSRDPGHLGATLAATLARGGDLDWSLTVRDGDRLRPLRVVGRSEAGADGRLRATGVLYAETARLHPTVNAG